MRHQYISRDTGATLDETLLGDRWISILYGDLRERGRWLFDILTGPRASGLLAWLQFDSPLSLHPRARRKFLTRLGIDLADALDPPDSLDTPRKIFERRIRYWESRPMPEDPRIVVSPSDGRVLLGTLPHSSRLFLKGKLFELDELLGPDQHRWIEEFRGGSFSVLRLTPDKYHYNHSPVSGRVLARYALDGTYHSCNPSAVIEMATPHSKNKRVVTILDTDLPGGSGAGLVAMVEVVALMIGDIQQCYSGERYDDPVSVEPGLWLERGRPKSLFRPGSSTVALLFQRGRVRFWDDLVRNQRHPMVRSRLAVGFKEPMVETDILVRSPLATAVAR